MNATSIFSVWHDKQEQWDPDNIDPPDLQCEVRDVIDAAERLADDSDSTGYLEFIVRDDAAGTYHRIGLVHSWTVKSMVPTTLKELSDP